jgi:hypothetical protein
VLRAPLATRTASCLNSAVCRDAMSFLL